MLSVYLPILLIVLSNLLYNITQKSTPAAIHPFAPLAVTYFLAFLISLIMLPFYPSKVTIVQSFKGLNWTSIGLAFAIVGLELGFLLAYRVNWSVSTTQIFTNILVTLLLVPVGIFLFREQISIIHILGIVLCIIGIILLNQK